MSVPAGAAETALKSEANTSEMGAADGNRRLYRVRPDIGDP